jgi:hypothetical protein
MIIGNALLTVIISKLENENKDINDFENFVKTIYEFIVNKKRLSKNDTYLVKFNNNETNMFLLNNFNIKEYKNDDYDFIYNKLTNSFNITTFGENKNFIGYNIQTYNYQNKSNELVNIYINDKNKIDESNDVNYIWITNDVPCILLYKMKYGEETTNFKIIYNSFVVTELDVSILMYNIFMV